MSLDSAALDPDELEGHLGDSEDHLIFTQAGEELRFTGWELARRRSRVEGAAGVGNEARVYATDDGRLVVGLRVDVEEEQPRRSKEFTLLETFTDPEDARRWLAASCPDDELTEETWKEALDGPGLSASP